VIQKLVLDDLEQFKLHVVKVHKINLRLDHFPSIRGTLTYNIAIFIVLLYVRNIYIFSKMSLCLREIFSASGMTPSKLDTLNVAVQRYIGPI
jgi:hypothetical protein